jgi:hypothetical protein
MVGTRRVWGFGASSFYFALPLVEIPFYNTAIRRFKRPGMRLESSGFV